MIFGASCWGYPPDLPLRSVRIHFGLLFSIAQALEQHMNALAIGGVVFAGALLGMYLRAVLPALHLGDDSKEIIRISTAMIATLAALVVGLLIASAKVPSIVRAMS
jgi:hypothetical protein